MCFLKEMLGECEKQQQKLKTLSFIITLEVKKDESSVIINFKGKYNFNYYLSMHRINQSVMSSTSKVNKFRKVSYYNFTFRSRKPLKICFDVLMT